jgi:hypothetical protein
MSIKTKDELITEFDIAVANGDESTAAEFRTLNENTIDSLDNFRTAYGDSKGTFKASGNSDLATDEVGDLKFIAEDGLIRQQTWNGSSWIDVNCCRPYEIYSAVVTQTGTNAPTANVLENTLGGTVVFTYLGVGQYAMTLAGAFPINKSYCVQHQMAGVEDNADTKFILYCKRNTDDIMLLETLNDSASNTNGLLKEQFLEIRVYP